jgi:hypothetical protein
MPLSGLLLGRRDHPSELDRAALLFDIPVQGASSWPWANGWRRRCALLWCEREAVAQTPSWPARCHRCTRPDPACSRRSDRQHSLMRSDPREPVGQRSISRFDSHQRTLANCVPLISYRPTRPAL